MEGRRADALKAAEDLRAKMHADMLRDPGMGGMVQHFHLTPLFVKLRFGMWNEILADDGAARRPAVHARDVVRRRAAWRWPPAGETAGAEREHAAVAELKDRPRAEDAVHLQRQRGLQHRRRSPTSCCRPTSPGRAGSSKRHATFTRPPRASRTG